MKYKKGTLVEVLSKREVPSGSWWRAEIISGNGHTYSIRYDPAPSGASELVERVPRKVIRPCPPSDGKPISLVTGDIIEVFDNGSWKLAEVSSSVDGCYFAVRVLGSSRVLNVEKSEIRLRQCWKDDHWIVIDKDVRKSESAKAVNGRNQKRPRSQTTSGSGRAENCEETTTSEEAIVGFTAEKRKVLDRKHILQRSPPKYVKKTNISGAAYLQRLYSLENRYCLLEKDRTIFSGLEMPSRRSNGDVSRTFTACIEPELSDSSVCSSSGSNYSPVLYSRPLYPATISKCGILVDDANSTGWSKF